jgi:hypothetical protein
MNDPSTPLAQRRLAPNFEKTCDIGFEFMKKPPVWRLYLLARLIWCSFFKLLYSILSVSVRSHTNY